MSVEWLFNQQGQRLVCLTVCLAVAAYCAAEGLAFYGAIFAFLAGGWTSAYLRRVGISMGVIRGDEP